MPDSLRIRARRAVDALDSRRRGRIGWLAVPAGTAVATAAGIALGVTQLHQWLTALALFPWLVLDLRAGDRRAALLRLGSWAAALTLVALLATLVAPGRTQALLPDSGFQHADTLAYVRTGQGELARPADFATDHALDYLYVTAGSAFGAGLAPLLMGARRVTLLAVEWGQLLREGGLSWRLWWLGLPPWSVLGAIGYGLLLVGWGEVTGAWLARRPVGWRPLARWVALGSAALALHLWWRIALPTSWRDWLAPLLGG